MSQGFVQISKDECKQLLDKYYSKKAHKIINFSLESISEEIHGFNSEQLLLRIQLENATNDELRFFVKSLPKEQETTLQFMKTANMFKKEIFCYTFFEEVKKECPAIDVGFAPKYYFSRQDDLIVLEDLTESGYKMWSNPGNLDLEHVQLTLKSAAKFHAASLCFEEMKSRKLKRKYRLMEDYAEYFTEGLYRKDEKFLGFQFIECGVKGLCALVDVLPNKGRCLAASEYKKKMWELFDQVFEDIKPMKKFRNVICNGDLWTKNVMFRYRNGHPVQCKIFDFQLQRYNPPAHDVLFLIYQATNLKTRQEYLNYFVDNYYDNLKEELKKSGFEIKNVISRDEFDLSLTAVLRTVKLTEAIYKSLSAISKESLQQINSNHKLYADFTFRDRSEFMIKEFNSHKSYRDVMTVILDGLLD